MPKPFVSVIIAAAGSSSRFGADKLFALLCGLPVLQHSISVFEENENFSEIIVAAREDLVESIKNLIKSMNAASVSAVVAGGSSRMLSVASALKAVSANADYIAVHDGARPLLSSECADKTLSAAVRHGAAVPCVNVKDTVKICGKGGFAVSSPPRETVFLAQTPQIFRSDIFHNAVAKALESGDEYTDDGAVVRAAGHPVFLSEGNQNNLKITTAEDLAVAEMLMKRRTN